MVNPHQTSLGVTGIVLLLGIPLAAIVLSGVRWIIGLNRVPRLLSAILLILWLAGLIICSSVALNVLRDFDAKSTYYTENEIRIDPDEILYLTMDEEFISNNYDYYENEALYGDLSKIIVTKNNELYLSPAIVDITVSDSKQSTIEIHYSSRGETRSQALRRAENTEYTWIQSGNTIYFQPFFKIGEGEKWRSQKVELSLIVPEGQIIEVDDNLNNIMDYDSHWIPYNVAGNKWIMTSNGLKKYRKEVSKNESNNSMHSLFSVFVKSFQISYHQI